MRTTPQGATASTAKLQTNLDTMTGASQSVYNAADAMHQQLMNIRNEIESLRGSWQSPTASAYCDQHMHEWDRLAGRVRDALHSIGGGIQSAQVGYRTSEEDNLASVAKASQPMI